MDPIFDKRLRHYQCRCILCTQSMAKHDTESDCDNEPDQDSGHESMDHGTCNDHDQDHDIRNYLHNNNNVITMIILKVCQ